MSKYVANTILHIFPCINKFDFDNLSVNHKIHAHSKKLGIIRQFSSQSTQYRTTKFLSIWNHHFQPGLWCFLFHYNCLQLLNEKLRGSLDWQSDSQLSVVGTRSRRVHCTNFIPEYNTIRYPIADPSPANFSGSHNKDSRGTSLISRRWAAVIRGLRNEPPVGQPNATSKSTPTETRDDPPRDRGIRLQTVSLSRYTVAGGKIEASPARNVETEPRNSRSGDFALETHLLTRVDGSSGFPEASGDRADQGIEGSNPKAAEYPVLRSIAPIPGLIPSFRTPWVHFIG